MNERVIHRQQTVIALQKQLNLLDHIPVGECVLRRDGTVLFWNACLENWTMLSRAQIIGRKIDDYFPHLRQLRYTRRLRETFEGGFSVIFSSQIHPHLLPCSGANGQLRVLHTIVTAIPAADAIGFDALLSIQDVTDLTQQIDSYKQIQERAWTEVKQRQTTEEQLRRDRELLSLRYEQERVVDRVVQHIRQSLNLQEILQTAAAEILTLLQADRVLIYRLTAADGTGRVVAEACHPDFPSLLKWTTENIPAAQQEQLFGYYKFPKICAVADINQSELDLTYVQFLQSLAVKARLAIPILMGKEIQSASAEPRTLWGWLIVHQCRSARTWQPEEVDLLKRLESQLAVAIHQSELLQQVHHLNVNLKRQVQAQTLALQQALTLESTLKRITDKVRDSLDQDQILRSVVKELGEALETSHCHTTLYSSSQGTPSIQRSYPHPDALPGDCDSPLQATALFEVYDQLLRGQHLAFCQMHPAQPHKPDRHAAIFACPILDDQGVLGDLWLFRPTASSFSDLEIRLVQQVANQCAIAIRQAQLYKASQQKLEELARLNHLKDDFLSTISHELRTPLVSIRMTLQTLELLLKSPEPPPENATQVDRYLHILEDECQREAKLIDDLLNLTRLEAGAEPIVRVPVHLECWLSYIAESFAERMQQHQQHLRLEIAQELPPLITDITILERILTELLNNAYKYTPAGEVITVSAKLTPPDSLPEKEDTDLTLEQSIAQPAYDLPPLLPAARHSQRRSICISISNTGVTVAASDLERIFNKFYRVPNVDPWNHGGTGLGLTLSKRMTEYLGGVMQAESENNLTQFTLELAIEP